MVVESSVIVLVESTVWTWVVVWLECSAAILAGAADSGSAGTILFEFGCAERMVSCGVAQVLAVVGEIAVMILVSGRLG